MNYYIKSIAIDNFRGINEQKKLLFSPNITLLYGNNGKGKTTVLQAIEWVLTGTISNFKSSPFKEEDAFINIFSGRKQCNVCLEISNNEGHGSFIVERTRKLSKSSTTTKTNTQLKLFNSKTYTSEVAQKKLHDDLELDPDNYIRNFYIRQDLIHGMLEDNPEDTSRGLDQILGTIHIRNLVDAVDIKSKINTSRRALDKRIKETTVERIAIAESIKKDIREIKNNLISNGLLEENLTLDNGINILNNLVKKGEEIFNIFSFQAFDISKTSLLNELRNETNRYIEQLNNLDLERQKKVSSMNGLITNITSLIYKYEETNRNLSIYSQRSYNNIELKKEELILKSKEISLAKDKIFVILNDLKTIKSTITLLEQQLSSLYDKYENKQNLNTLIEENQKSLTKIRQKLKSINLFESLLTDAIKYIESLKENSCPVCDNSIEYNVLLSKLKNKTDPEINSKIQSYKEQENIFLTNISEMNGDLLLINDKEEKIKKEKDDLADLMKEIRKNTDIELSNNLDDDILKLNNKYESYDNVLNSIKNQINDFDKVNSLLSSKVKLERELQSKLNSNSVNASLVNEGREYIINTQNELKLFDTEGYYQRNILDIKLQAENLLNGLLNYLEKEDKVKQVMKEIDDNSQSISEINEKKDQLDFFEGTITNILDVASKYLEEEVYQQIEKHGNLIDEIYNKIEPHPVLRHVSLEIHNHNQILYSIKVSDNNNIKTSALTRFSMAQMNIFAISILTANNIKLCERFPLLVFDDPSHSMDDFYKERLSNFICHIGKNRQIIIATSDNNFKTYMEKYGKNNLKVIQFMEWSSKGPTIM